jgi:hypothetical protein
VSRIVARSQFPFYLFPGKTRTRCRDVLLEQGGPIRKPLDCGRANRLGVPDALIVVTIQAAGCELVRIISMTITRSVLGKELLA